MAILFPLKINDTKLYVNPEHIKVRKRSDVSRTKTMAGTTFQIWPDLPDEIHFEGVFFGLLALSDIRAFQSAIDQPPDKKQVTLTYKLRKYQGYMTNFEIGADAEKPRMFPYSFDFVSKQPTRMTDMLLGQLTGFAEEYDYIQAELLGASTTIAGTPSSLEQNVLNAASSIGNVGMNIGRPTTAAAAAFKI